MDLVLCPWAPPQSSVGSLCQGIGAALLHPSSQMDFLRCGVDALGTFQLGFHAWPGATSLHHQRE